MSNLSSKCTKKFYHFSVKSFHKTQARRRITDSDGIRSYFLFESETVHQKKRIRLESGVAA